MYIWRILSTGLFIVEKPELQSDTKNYLDQPERTKITINSKIISFDEWRGRNR